MSRPVITAESIREFAARDRTKIAALKLAHWASEYRLRGATATIAISRALFDRAQRSGTIYPNRQQRDEDLRDHVALKLKLDRVADVLRAIR